MNTAEIQQFGQWKLKKKLGQGREGNVYLVERETDSKIFAMKTPSSQNTLINEVAALKRMDHPNIQKLIDCELDGKYPYIITKYCQGGTLSQANIKYWDMERRILFFRGLCAGVMHAMEQGVIINGLHSSNIFINKTGGPVVGDFGSAYTPEYFSEEVIKEGKVRMLYSISSIHHLIMEGRSAHYRLMHSIPKSIFENEHVIGVHERMKEFE